MRKRLAYKVLRKYGLIHQNWKDKDISRFKNILHPRETWKQFVLGIIFAKYIVGEVLDEGIYIKELNLMYGGTLKVDLT